MNSYHLLRWLEVPIENDDLKKYPKDEVIDNIHKQNFDHLKFKKKETLIKFVLFFSRFRYRPDDIINKVLHVKKSAKLDQNNSVGRALAV